MHRPEDEWDPPALQGLDMNDWAGAKRHGANPARSALMASPKPWRCGDGEYRRILCPTNLSSRAEVGVEQAAQRAAREGATVVLVHVLPSAAAYAALDVTGSSSILPFTEQWRADAWRRLCHIRERLRQRGVVTHAVLLEGFPADQITRVAGRLRCDAIVLETRGRRGLLRRLLCGCVAEGIIQRSPCPVFAYPSPQPRSTRGCLLKAAA